MRISFQCCSKFLIGIFLVSSLVFFLSKQNTLAVSTTTLITGQVVDTELVELEERDLDRDMRYGLWNVQVAEFNNCKHPVILDSKRAKKYTFAWRRDSSCSKGGPTGRTTLRDYTLTVSCPSGYTWDMSYRKGLIPHLFVYEKPVRINDAEMITTFCDFDMEKRVVQNVEKPKVKERQEAIYRRTHRHDNSGHYPLSINVVMIDGVSRPHFIRAMKLTASLLEVVHANSEAYGFKVFQFLRYSVVGKNSIYNLTPLVSGRRLVESKWGQNASREFYHDSWLWKHARKNGYATMYADEQCQYRGHIVPWQAPKFIGGAEQVDVDHWFGSMFCEANKAPYGKEKRCISDRQAHEYMFEYLESFFDHYKSIPKFAWNIFYEAHEPSMSLLPLMDGDLKVFLEKSMDDLKRVTVLLSDHGPHYGPYTKPPFPGAIEHKYPLLLMLVPIPFLQRYPEIEKALLEKEQALMTAFDVYSILLQLLTWPHPPTGDVPSRFRQLLQPGSLKPDRTCAEAEIPREFCVCDRPSSWAKLD